MVYDSVLSDVGEKLGEDYYILPSSIHECIVIPKKEEIDPEELKIMVREINATQVQPEEVLSDEIYQYERRYHRLSMVLETEEYYPFLKGGNCGNLHNSRFKKISLKDENYNRNSDRNI